jgi:hypothetical protein
MGRRGRGALLGEPVIGAMMGQEPQGGGGGGYQWTTTYAVDFRDLPTQSMTANGNHTVAGTSSVTSRAGRWI